MKIANFLNEEFKQELINHCKTFRNLNVPDNMDSAKVYMYDDENKTPYAYFDDVRLEDDMIIMDNHKANLVLNGENSITITPDAMNLPEWYTNLINDLNIFIMRYEKRNGPVMDYIAFRMSDEMPEYIRNILLNSVLNLTVKEMHDDKYVLSKLHLNTFKEMDDEECTSNKPDISLEYTIPRQKNLWMIIYKGGISIISETEFSDIDYRDYSLFYNVTNTVDIDSLIEIIKNNYTDINSFNNEINEMKDKPVYHYIKAQLLGNMNGLVFYFRNGVKKDNFYIRDNILFRFVTKFKELKFPEEEFGQW